MMLYNEFYRKSLVYLFTYSIDSFQDEPRRALIDFRLIDP